MVCRRTDTLCVCIVSPEVPFISAILVRVTMKTPSKNTCTEHGLLKNVRRFSHSSFTDVIEFA